MKRKIALLYHVSLNAALQELTRSLFRSGYSFVVIDDGVASFLSEINVGDLGSTIQTVAQYGPLMEGEDTDIDLVVALLDPSIGDDDFYYCQRIISYYCQQKIPVITSELDFSWFLARMSHPTKKLMDWIKRKALSMVSLTQLAISVEKDRPN